MAGDDCLIRVAGVIRAEFRRAGDFAARYGGEEFAVILPETSQAGALARAEALRHALAASGLPHPDNDGEHCVTVSIGVAAGEGRPNSPTPTALIQAADAGLYLAKQQGRNRVCVAHERPYDAQSL